MNTTKKKKYTTPQAVSVELQCHSHLLDTSTDDIPTTDGNVDFSDKSHERIWENNGSEDVSAWGE